MTVRYDYRCNACGFTYVEQRPANEEQIYKVCYVCKKGGFDEIGSEVLSQEVERVEAPAPIVEAEQPTA